jgi:diguanylate cyclase (GGDEF)-like protein
MDVAKTLAKEIETLSIVHARAGSYDKVSLSQGIASIIPAADASPESIIELADQALYQAKQQGRNRYVASPAK